jgi:hypothetical protein
MTTWAVMAPGPSARPEQARALSEAGIPIGAVSLAYQIVPDAAFIAASDRAWWRNYHDAKARTCPKFAMSDVSGVERVHIPQLGAVCNSGVLGLEVAKRMGATRILLLGVDMHGSHFNGPYVNGLRNTAPHQRKIHMQQYAHWGQMNRGIKVINVTKGSALTCFPMATLAECIVLPAALN